ELEIPGEISDSRIVGGVLYAVSYQNGSCYHCAAVPRTIVTSLDVSNPASVRKVDELAFDDVQDQWGWGKRSITVTAARMYVAGRESSSSGALGSLIQVVDISDPRGDLVLGASVRADGQITSRWQMDEYQGVLRVVSQPWQWTQDTTVPTVQTYQVHSSNQLTPLGKLALRLPRPEQLQSTRFDGTRAYAITAQRTDPLFTIDLSDPARPRQAGELEMPGFIYHMEPRGDRLIGLGFDQQNTQGALHVNLFDVSNLDNPTLIRRVNFGGSWASLPEDQDRIQKAFKVLDAQGLILVPFSGNTKTSDPSGCGSTYMSGIQLIDFTRDTLALGGVAPVRGEARRALTHREALFTVSDERVQTFDITNRGAPRLLDSVALARQVRRSAGLADHIVRLGGDWWSGIATLDVTPVTQPDSPQGLGSIELTSAATGSCNYSYVSDGQLFAHGSRAYVLYEDYSYPNWTRTSALAVVNFANRSAPKLEANKTLGTLDQYVGSGIGGYAGVVASGESVVQVGSTFVLARAQQAYDPLTGVRLPPKTWLDVIDASTPSDIDARRLDLPFAGISGLIADGTTVLTSHYETSVDASKVRFYLDRVDVSNPAAPRLLEKVNVPGSLLAWDATSKRAITVDYRRTAQNDVPYTTCSVQGGSFTPRDFTNYYVGTCTWVQQTIRQVRIDGNTAALEGSFDVPNGLNVGSAAVGDDRVFVGLGRRYYYYSYPPGGCGLGGSGGCGAQPQATPALLLTLSDLQSGAIHPATLEVASGFSYGEINQLLAFGKRALVASAYGNDDLTLVDSADGGVPRVLRKVNVTGSLYEARKHGNLALLSLGYDGLQVVDVAQ
ncbi:MAG TPA: beta-propeller domain-containing protein, partial [Polyangiaceae bacterium]|nr:beta-propeller domain-containing protein [Polyangiaceae bacterium]